MDLVGRTFGRLTVLARGDNTPRGQARWLCKCVCGKTLVVMGWSLKSGRTRSCGCLQRELAGKKLTTHGMSGTSTHHAWVRMRRRCSDTNYRSYPWYGGRGIKVCKRWGRFEVFLKDMGERPPGKTLDRINPDGAYKPSNCRWATWVEQGSGRRNNRVVEFEGRKAPLSVLCRGANLPYATVLARLDKLGWPVGRALSERVHR